MKRRGFLVLSSVTASTLLTGCLPMLIMNSDLPDVFNGQGTPENLKNAGLDQKLSIPPLLEGKNIAGVYHYDLNIQEAQHPFFKGVLTNTYAVNGTYLAPTLRLRKGEKVSINYKNNLKVNTTMHGHGMHVPAKMDGTAHQLIRPNERWSAQYEVKQNACTNWYHPHAMGTTAEQVYKGLAGFIIIEDETSLSLDLPKRYGVDDIPLVLQDRFFDKQGQIDYSPNMRQKMVGYKGDTFIANGVINPYVEVEAKEIRLRLLNGSNSSVYHLNFHDNRTFKQIAGDNSFLEQPVEMNELRLSPGERAEIVVDLSDSLGQTLYLQEKKKAKNFLKIDVTQKANVQTKVPTHLTTLEKYNEKDAVRKREFTLSGRMGRVAINNKSMDMKRIDEVLRLNDVEIWEVHNSRMMMMQMEHNFHIHSTHFRVLERNGSRENVLENERGYKDTVYLAPGDSVKLIVKMTDYVDSKIPYMYHCHFLEHEDAGMMGQFVVM